MDINLELNRILPSSRVKTRLIDLVSYASDAGFYRLVPKAVVQPVNEEEVRKLFQFSHQYKIPLVFRTGGTSLSGQSITDGILVDLSQHWDEVGVEADGDVVKIQPGITGAMVNARLKKFNRKIGPDPASINAAMMGGILSNNSSGMCCGVKFNAYHTLKHIRFILPDGRSFNTSIAGDYQRFESECPELFDLLRQIKTEILSNTALFEKIRGKYHIKNTMGYSLNAFADFAHPLDILAHLLIGAEGTLAFIAEASLETIPDYQFKSTALLYFPNIYTACQAIVPLTDAGARAVELMDRASLSAIENLPGMPAEMKLLPAGAAALLTEFQENSYDDLALKVNSFLTVVPSLALLNAPVFTNDPKEQDLFWKVRKGLFPAVGAVRASGSTVILEDVAFPVQKLGDAILDLQVLFQKYEYHNAIVFGHAKDGNIHFVITPSFNSAGEIERYGDFMDEVVELVVKKYDGALKAEHGTGRNMAPFVETEWGADAYRIMKKIKMAVDPELLLNPGVIINDDKRAHLVNIKPLPPVEEEVDKCIECGFCEHKCPSRNLTTTPRRRIVIRRELVKFKAAKDAANYKLLLKQYEYDGMDTCAVDGLCATACPVDINTGDLIKRLRRENHSQFSNRLALWTARNFKIAESGARAAVKTGTFINRICGKNAMKMITGGLKKVIGAMPLWTEQISYPPSLSAIRSLPDTVPVDHGDSAILYFPGCISRIMGGNDTGKKNIMETFISVSEKAGIAVIVPGNITGSCCSQVFSSKGYQDAQRFKANEIIEKLWEASNKGALKVVTDISSCAYTLHHLRPVLNEANQQKFDQLSILDSVDYLHDMVLPVLGTNRKRGNIVLHPVCSLQKMNTQDKFASVACKYAATVTIPAHAGCCGMAGDRGFLFPELTSSATLPEALEVKKKKYDGYYSSTKTCEMAMTHAVNENYESILYLLDDVC